MADKTFNDQNGEDNTPSFGDKTTNDTGDSYTRKHLFDVGYTTYHEDGTSSETQESIFGCGYITRRSNGSETVSTRDSFGTGYTTRDTGIQHPVPAGRLIPTASVANLFFIYL